MIEKYSYEQIEEIQEALKICADIVYLSDNVSSHLKDSNYMGLAKVAVGKARRLPKELIIGKFGSSLKNLEKKLDIIN